MKNALGAFQLPTPGQICTFNGDLPLRLSPLEVLPPYVERSQVTRRFPKLQRTSVAAPVRHLEEGSGGLLVIHRRNLREFLRRAHCLRGLRPSQREQAAAGGFTARILRPRHSAGQAHRPIVAIRVCCFTWAGG